MIEQAFRRGSAADLARADRILEVASQESGFAIESLRGPSRRAELVWVRHLAMAALRRASNLSLPQIGRLFGGRHHTTVMHGISRAEAAALARPEVEALLSRYALDSLA